MTLQGESSSLAAPRLGIRANLSQFSLLVLVNAFVGAMVGMERSILPLIAEQDFGITSHGAILSFIAGFGLVKAFSNLLAGKFSDHFGRKKLLILGWLMGIPVPFILMSAHSWSWILFANLLLGVNQGLCWSMTVIMKIDLAGPARRGAAMGFNEFAGYLAVAATAYITASLAAAYGLRPVPFYLGIGVSFAALLTTVLFVRETHHFTGIESGTAGSASGTAGHSPGDRDLWTIFVLGSWKSKNLSACSQAGLFNNFNDGMMWGLFPLLLASLGMPLERIGVLAAIYPAAWGSTQLITGALSDRLGRKWMIAAGMWLQGCAILLIAYLSGFASLASAAILLGLGTAMVYPTLLAAVSDSSLPIWRASAVGVYRLWRDLGYALGAVVCGLIADLFGIRDAIVFTGCITVLSGLLFAMRFKDGRGPGGALISAPLTD